MRQDNLFKGYSKKQIKAIHEILRNFYYGPDLANVDIRNFYTALFADIKAELKEAAKHKKIHLKK